MLAASHNSASVEERSGHLLRHGDAISQCSPVVRHSLNVDPLVMKVCDCRTEREQALQLVQKVYSRAGLAKDTFSHLRVMRQHLSECTDIIVGKRASRVVFTVSLIGDGEYGLPLEAVFGEEVASMRAEGLNLAEISCLANEWIPGDERGRYETFLNGMSLLAQTARSRGIDRLLLAVHPRHAKFYERLLGCMRCSDSREYAAVQGNPAVLCMHDFAQLDQTGYPYFKRIYNTSFEPWQLGGVPMSSAEKHYFEQFLPSREYEFMPIAG